MRVMIPLMDLYCVRTPKLGIDDLYLLIILKQMNVRFSLLSRLRIWVLYIFPS